MDGRCLRSPHDVEGDGLMRVAAKAFHFEIAVSGIECIAECGRWLRQTLSRRKYYAALALKGATCLQSWRTSSIATSVETAN